jgi:hypothetical protein
MSKYPVEISDGEGIVDAVNYLLSGPSGLGQNFGGVSFSDVGYVAGTSTDPYMSETSRQLQTDFIDIDTGYFLDSITVKIEFVGAPLGDVPFVNGDSVYVLGTSETNVNGFYTVGVIECTNSYVILRDPTAYTPTPGTFTGGVVTKFNTFDTYYPDSETTWLPTDCNSFATVTSDTDRVFISAQTDFNVFYTVTIAATYQLNVHFSINRYKAIPGEPTINPKINFMFDGIVSDVTYGFSGITTSGSTGLQPGPVFVSVIDKPGPGYYWYVLEVQFDRNGPTSGLYVDYLYSNRRSLSTQVVKQ